MPCSRARRKTNGRKPTPWTWPVRQIRRVSRAAADAARSAGGGAGFLAAFPDILARAGGPPDAARTLVGDHARPDGLARCAGGAEQAALVGIDLAEYHLGAVAARRHLAHALAGVVRVGRELPARVAVLVLRAQAVARLRYHADAAPSGVLHLHDPVQALAGHRVAARAHDLGVAVVQKALVLDELAQHRVHGGQQGVGAEAGNRSRDAVLLRDEGPFLGAHHRGD